MFYGIILISAETPLFQGRGICSWRGSYASQSAISKDGGYGTITWKLKKKVQEALSRERGTVYKDPGGRVSVCLVYPNRYSLGMTNLGFQTVYRLLNDLDDCVCERAFLPSKEAIEEFSRTSTPLFSYESRRSLKEFDIIAFSVPFEEDYLNIPRILELSGLPVFASERKGAGPLIVAGGVAVSLNPEPLADMMDLFLIGEGEGSLGPFMGLYSELASNGASRRDIISAADSIDWVYAPSLYAFTYEGARIKEVAISAGAKGRVRAAKSLDLSPFPIPRNFILTPDAEFRNTHIMEVERGCGRGCRFCAAGFLYLPPRWRDIGKVKEAVRAGMDDTGKVGLVGTAVSEYPEIKEALNYGCGLGGSMTLSSLRMDRLDGEFLDLLKKGGYKTITLAPEAGTERMRGIINKGIDEEEIFKSLRLIRDAGFLKMKLYFIVGLPNETDEDAKGIAELTKRIKALIKGELTLSVNPFVPKPFTPFQWHPFERISVLEKRLKIIKDGLSSDPGIRLDVLPPKEAFIQAYLSRGDRRAGRVIAEASKAGWRRAMKPRMEFIEESVYMARSRDEVLPWDIIDHGVKKAYLWKEYVKGLGGELTPPCDVGSCFRCGVCRPESFR